MKKFLKIKNHIRESQLFTNRIIFSFVVAALLSFILIVRLGYLQLTQHDLYSTLSTKNFLGVIPIEGNRGLIFDRNGVLLAQNRPSFNLSLIPDRVKNIDKTIQELQELVSINDIDIANFKRSLKRLHPFEPVTLRFKLSEEEVAKFYVNQYRFPGAVINVEMIRYYPFKEVMTPAIGYVGRINQNELSQLDSVNYQGSNYMGKTGIEKYYEPVLHGRVGFEEVEMDANGKVVRSLKKKAPVPGKNLYLTIDSELQIAAQKALGTESGAVVAIEPSTGDILALVSNPSYDPNLFVAGISQKDYSDLLNSAEHPLYNRAVRGQFPPGSTIKPFYALALLDLNIVNVDYHISDPGIFRLPHVEHVYHDWKKGGHGLVNIVTAITVSCDIYFYTVALKLGIKHMDEYLNSFGFGTATQIDLPDELPGLVPSPEWKHAKHAAAWYPGDTVITGIGQGYLLVTPLQLAAATAMIANRGLRYQPHLLSKTEDLQDGRVAYETKALNPLVLKEPGTWEIVIEGMQQVLQSQHGTAWAVGHTMPYTAAAKTGTAEVYGKHDPNITDAMVVKRLRNNHLFISFAPLDHPKIAIAVIVEHENIANKVARAVLDQYLVTEKKGETNESL